MALVTQANLEKHLQVVFDNQPLDPVVSEYLTQAQAIADAICRQPLEEETGIVETFEVDQPDAWFVLSRFPVSQVSAVAVDGTALGTDEFRSYTDGRIRRLVSGGGYDTSWSYLIDGNSVTYDAGYGGAIAAPDDLVLGITIIAAQLFRNGARYAADGAKGVKSVRLEGSDQIEFALPEPDVLAEGFIVPTRATTILAPYMRRKM
jgi:hypothetical protein